MTYPIISVIIPNYNRTNQLQRTINSVLSQSYTNFEIVIIDDASKIDPKPYVEVFSDERIKLFVLEKNGGAAAARNKAATLAIGKYIAFLDSDDEWLPDFLKRRVQLMEENNCDGIYGATRKYANQQLIDLPPVRQVEKNESMIDYLLSGTLRAVTSTLFFKKDAFLDILFDKTLVPHEDYVLNIEFHKKYNYLCDTVPNTIYHANKGSLSQSIKDAGVRFLKKYGYDLSFKWLFFFCLRKSAHAIANNEQYLIPQYIELLQDALPKASWFFKLNFYLFKAIPNLYIQSFDFLAQAALKIRKIFIKLKFPSKM